ncbi:MAG: hypothetical protein ACRDNZ_14605 [Streptosporangiaceae bacterium]
MLIIVFLVAAIMTAAITVLITLTVIGIAHEEAGKSLRLGPPTLASALARRIVGLHITFRP